MCQTSGLSVTVLHPFLSLDISLISVSLSSWNGDGVGNTVVSVKFILDVNVIAVLSVENKIV